MHCDIINLIVIQGDSMDRLHFASQLRRLKDFYGQESYTRETAAEVYTKFRETPNEVFTAVISRVLEVYLIAPNVDDIEIISQDINKPELVSQEEITTWVDKLLMEAGDSGNCGPMPPAA